MNTIGWVLILLGALLIRQVARGRTMQLGEDLSDALLAIVRGDADDFGQVLARTGTGNAPVAAVGDASGPAGVSGPAPGAPVGGIAGAAVARGEKAKGYKWLGVGPDFYDCSGLMWRACQDVGYTGTRFTTATLLGRVGFERIDAADAGVGDLVLWRPGSGGVTGHVGVLTGPDRFYSARSTKSGIGYARLTGYRKTKPIYVRYSTATTASRAAAVRKQSAT